MGQPERHGKNLGLVQIPTPLTLSRCKTMCLTNKENSWGNK